MLLKLATVGMRKRERGLVYAANKNERCKKKKKKKKKRRILEITETEQTKD